jgi:uncharacterized repeat protein (TIGR03803 family)
MKKNYYILFLMLVLMQFELVAQQPQLIGATRSGGVNNSGIIYKINLDGSGFTPIYSFSSTGSVPIDKMISGNNNLLYGVNKYELFSFDPIYNYYKLLHQFYVGEHSYGGLVLASNGFLYGTIDLGNGSFSIFSYDPKLNMYKLLTTVSNQTLGYNPQSTLMQGSDGKLYGTTYSGGIYNDGVIFSFNINNNTYTKEYDFNHNVNSLITRPKGGLTQASGIIYGFSGFDSNGKALVYSFNPSTRILSVVHEFPANYFRNYDAQPTLTVDFFGTKIYGVTSGSSNPQQNQKIFYITILDKSYHESFTFTGSDGDGPAGGLLNYNANHFYGITKAGGISNNGVIFQYDASKFGGFIKQHDFAGGSEGAIPISNLTYVSCTAKPAKPGTISGKKDVICNKKTKYAIAPVAGATSYTWTVPAGASINGSATDTVVTVLWGTQSGNLSVQAVNDCGKSSKKTIAVSVNCSGKESATVNKEMISQAGVFPNPTNGNATLKFYSENASKYSIHISDFTGRVLLTYEINATAGENIAPLDLSKLSKGFYAVELTGDADKKAFKVEVQ